MPQLDICEVVFEVAQFGIADADGEYNELMHKLRQVLDPDLFGELDQTSNMRVYHAQREAFKVGWQLRGKV